MTTGPQATTTDLKVEYRNIESLTEYEGNSRTHDDDQVAQVAASIQEFGFTNPLLVDANGVLIAGHGRLLAARKLGFDVIPVIELGHLTESQRRAYVIADNKLAELSGWDEDALARELAALTAMEYDSALTGFSADDIGSILDAANNASKDGLTDPDAVPEVEDNAPEISHTGDVWLLGSHRAMCGDSTSATDVAKLMNGETAALVHADPPYGMGKEGDGVANDNLYREKLDAFQMEWWRTFRQHIVDNASAYIWGNAPDLWRLWYVGGLRDSEYLELRNQIAWDKKSIPGMKSDLMTQYPITTEHCIFFQFGKQFIGNINSEDYWEGWDDIRLYLKEQADACGLTASKLREVCGVQMYSHWFTKSQWSFISEKHYLSLQVEFPGYFQNEYKVLRQTYDEIKGGYRNHINGIQGGMRAYFDNAHDIMRDVWEFSRVVGEERHGHATPKPVAMMERVMNSSLPVGGLCCEPFGGSGSTLMGAERSGRRCFTMEMQGKYVDVIVKRWQAYTGKMATLEGDGRSFNEITEEREELAA